MTSNPRREALLAGCVGLLAFLVYSSTLYPGLVGIGDTPKFQYVGAVLGTPHNPGYPLYLLVSHLFSYLPVGSLAYRMNLLSAVCAALATALGFVVQRRLCVSRPVAAAVALAAGFGPVFWSQATLAEVYSLAGALLLAVTAALLAWGAAAPAEDGARPARGLLLAVGFTALALGHHLTIVCVAPALLLYALAVDARGATRPRVLAGSFALLALGLVQYLLILVRTRQGAPYLGSRATTLVELWDVVRGAQFAERLFAFDARSVLLERLPRVAELFAAELGLAGCALALLGAASLARRRAREMLLLGGGLLGVVGFVLNYAVDDTPVFLIPAFLLAWPLVGVGFDTLTAPLRSRLGRAAGFVALAAWLLPAHQLTAHYRASDHSGRTFEARYFRAVFEALPPEAAVLAESYTVDQMVLYQIHGEGYGASKRVRLVTRDPESVQVYAGRWLPVYAFGRAHAELAPLGFRFAPVTLYDRAAAGRAGNPRPEAFSRRAFPLFRLRGLPECVSLGDGGWRDATALARDGRLLARLDNFEPFEAVLSLRLWTRVDAPPRVARVAGRGRPELEAQPPRSGGEPWLVTLRVNDGGHFAALRLELGAAPDRLEAGARVDRLESDRARLCRLAPGDE